MVYYLPAGMAWWSLRFFPDNDFVNSTMKLLVAITTAGPFIAYWRAIGTWISTADNGCYGYSNGNCDTLYSYSWFYIGLALYTIMTLFEMIIQSFILPKVFDGIGEGDFEGLQFFIWNLL